MFSIHSQEKKIDDLGNFCWCEFHFEKKKKDNDNDENHISSIDAILKHKQVACMTRKMLFTIFKYLFVPEIFQFLKYAN